MLCCDGWPGESRLNRRASHACVGASYLAPERERRYGKGSWDSFREWPVRASFLLTREERGRERCVDCGEGREKGELSENFEEP